MDAIIQLCHHLRCLCAMFKWLLKLFRYLICYQDGNSLKYVLNPVVYLKLEGLQSI